MKNPLKLWLELTHYGAEVEYPIDSVAEAIQQKIFGDERRRLIPPGGEVTYTVKFRHNKETFWVSAYYGEASGAMNIIELLLLITPETLDEPKEAFKFYMQHEEALHRIASYLIEGRLWRAIPATSDLIWDIIVKKPWDIVKGFLGIWTDIVSALTSLANKIVYAIQTEGLARIPTVMFEIHGIPVPEEERNLPPDTFITQADIREKMATFTWEGRDDHTRATDLVYRYYLEGYDSTWSEWTSMTSVNFSNLPIGSYTFKVQARDQTGKTDPAPAKWSFTIDPLYEPAKPSADLNIDQLPPHQIVLGQSFELVVKLKNSGETVGSDFVGSIFVAFPSLTQRNYEEQASIEAFSDMEISKKRAGDQITARGGERVPAEHLEVRTDKIGWDKNEEHWLRIKVTPRTEGRFEVNVRGGFINIPANRYVSIDPISIDPALGFSVDHRGWAVYSRKIEVKSRTHTLTVQAPSPSEGGSINPAPNTYTRNHGEVVTVTAIPNPGWRVDRWEGTDNDASTATSNTVTMTSDKTVRVYFERVSHTLTVQTPSPSEGGSINPAPNTYTKNHGEIVTLTAYPNSGWRVQRWSGTDNDASTATTNTVTMNEDRTVKVYFERVSYTLTVQRPSPSDGGSINPAPNTYTRNHGEVVTVTAIPNPGWRVDRWEGTDNDASTATSNTVTMTSDKTVRVYFERILVPGDVNRDGQVDVLDLASIAGAYNTKQGDPNYNPDADFNRDGMIDIFDLVRVGLNFGKD
ncbi:MAG: hypothetical protein DDT33_01273 [Firmicutes bacterium]|nr:hypothetical protein [Bacillota bacterium]